MTDDLEQMTLQAFCFVMESLAFMFPEPVEPEDFPRCAEPGVEANLTFSGPVAGEMRLSLCQETCAEVARNLMGLDFDTEVSQDQAHDALRELVNVTCGELLVRLTPKDATFDLSVPYLQRFDSSGWEERADGPDSLLFVIDGAPAVLQIEVEEG